MQTITINNDPATISGHETGRQQMRNFLGRYDEAGVSQVRGEWEDDTFVTVEVLEDGEWTPITRDGQIDHA